MRQDPTLPVRRLPWRRFGRVSARRCGELRGAGGESLYAPAAGGELVVTGAKVEVEASVSGDGPQRGKASEFMRPRSDWWGGHVTTSVQAVDGVTGRRMEQPVRRPAGCGFTWTQTWCGCTVSAWLACPSDFPALSVPGFSGRILAGCRWVH